MRHALFLVGLIGVLLAGCATNRIDWSTRVGSYTYDEAVREMGPPDKVATLTDGSKVAEWLTARGAAMGGSIFYSRGYVLHQLPYSDGPDYFIRLSFDPQGRLTAHKQVVK